MTPFTSLSVVITGSWEKVIQSHEGNCFDCCFVWRNAHRVVMGRRQAIDTDSWTWKLFFLIYHFIVVDSLNLNWIVDILELEVGGDA